MTNRPVETFEQKAARLIRYHRQNVFGHDDRICDLHAKAIRRIKALPVWQEADQLRRAQDLHRQSERLLRLYA